jgi:hypothetical protein
VERCLLGAAPLVTAGRRGASVRAVSASLRKPCDRGDHRRTSRWTASVNIRTLSAGRRGSPPADRKPGRPSKRIAGMPRRRPVRRPPSPEAAFNPPSLPPSCGLSGRARDRYPQPLTAAGRQVTTKPRSRRTRRDSVHKPSIDRSHRWPARRWRLCSSTPRSAACSTPSSRWWGCSWGCSAACLLSGCSPALPPGPVRS